MTENFDAATVLGAFDERFGGPARLFRAPARINIIGEHTDYNDGLVMPTNADMHTWLAISPRDDRKVRLYTLNFDERVEIDLDDIRADADGGWQEYPKGVNKVLLDEGYGIRGANILVAGDIPLQSGLSSSASLETVVGLALVSCADEQIDRTELARLCQRAENDFVGLSCGIMDQFVIASCDRAHAMMLDCRSLDTRLVPLPDNARLLIVHSGVQRHLRSGGYNDRRDECDQLVGILAGLLADVSALRDVGLEELDNFRGQIGERLLRRGRHVVTENERVRTALRALQQGDLETLGRAMSESHASLRDDFEISCDAVDTLVDIARNCAGVYGSRMVGGGFGGCTVTLVAADEAGRIAADVVAQYAEHLGRTPWHHLLGSTEPVCELTPP